MQADSCNETCAALRLMLALGHLSYNDMYAYSSGQKYLPGKEISRIFQGVCVLT